MSMSQEEIESLMNGLDIAEDEASQEIDESAVSEDVETLTSLEFEDDKNEKTEENIVVEDVSSSNDSIEALISENNVEETNTTDNEQVSTEDIDELLASIETNTDTTDDDIVDNNDIDDLLASLDDVQEEEFIQATPPQDISEAVETEIKTESTQQDTDEAVRENVENKIENGVFPLPADPESKVVSQLSAVANDSEEKATKIFDVLSFILDENSKIEQNTKKIDNFFVEQEKVLNILSEKFPNVDVFSSNLALLNELKDEPQLIRKNVMEQNNELFSAMELMQYHDINRQKIERVMSVIRKLSIYLNNIFEDDHTHQEIAVAKHISGDKTDDLVGADDIEALIEEFGK